MAREYDVVVVGAGPAGASAAAAVARTGMSVALVEAGDLPRPVTCGGALVRPVLDELAELGPMPLGTAVTDLGVSHRGGPTTLRQFEKPILTTVSRADFDDWLIADAVTAGADIIAPCTVLEVIDQGDDVLVRTTHGEYVARLVIAADGSRSALAEQVGVTWDREDVGIELELEVGDLVSFWEHRAHLDFGPVPGSFGWVLPQLGGSEGDLLHVGVFADRAHAADARKYLWELLKWQRIDWMPVRRESGRVIRHRAASSPLAKGRILVAGEAAGLVEPWSRDGILMAIRSGKAAGEIGAIGVIAESTPEEIAAAYEDALAFRVLPEIADGELSLSGFERHSATFFQIFARSDAGWRAFRQVTTDETLVARLSRGGDVEAVVAAVQAQLTGDPEDVAKALEKHLHVPLALTGTDDASALRGSPGPSSNPEGASVETAPAEIHGLVVSPVPAPVQDDVYYLF